MEEGLARPSARSTTSRPRIAGCFTATGLYWVLFVSHAGGPWVNSDVGASSLSVTNGDDIGFRYDSQSGADPPPPSPAGTCPVVTPPPAPTRTPAPTVGSTPSPRTASFGRCRGAAPSIRHNPHGGSDRRILGIATPGATAAPLASVRSPVEQAGDQCRILLAAIGAGALIGLLGISVLRGAANESARARRLVGIGITIALATGNPVYRVLVLLCALNLVVALRARMSPLRGLGLALLVAGLIATAVTTLASHTATTRSWCCRLRSRCSAAR